MVRCTVPCHPDNRLHKYGRILYLSPLFVSSRSICFACLGAQQKPSVVLPQLSHEIRSNQDRLGTNTKYIIEKQTRLLHCRFVHLTTAEFDHGQGVTQLTDLDHSCVLTKKQEAAIKGVVDSFEMDKGCGLNISVTIGSSGSVVIGH
eukprot:COSAG06_NODE_7174_length_2597_cov_31.316653_2_plen_147_part_00